ncbi:MAG: BON domain-containing protein [Rickettsiaceae bacterium]|nr:BON domain-containing protein [Rickettsiaceae bacterium]
MKSSLLTLLMVTSLTSCLPIVFTGSTISAVEFAKDRSAGDTITDMRISTNIKAKLAKHSFKKLYSLVTVQVVNRRVLFTGSVLDKKEIVKAVQIAWNESGVREVINEIKVDQNSDTFDLGEYTRDTMITSQIKAKTLTKSDIKFANYNIITIKGVVYIFGIARSEEELEKVARIAANTHKVEKVISHVQVKVPAAKEKPHTEELESDVIITDDEVTDGLDLDEELKEDW